jgi:UDP-GlcNAc:undecaprenyl-phosphate GlcNAc-1-phosphate transferase
MTLQTGLMAAMAFAVSAGLVPALRGPALRLGLVDRPCHRKRHDGTIPLTGGLAIFLAFMTALLLGVGHLGNHAGLLLGMTILLIAGVVDDLIDLRALHKLVIQITVTTIVVIATDLQINQLGPLFGPSIGNIGLGPLSAPFTVACFVFMINVINMADGVDGLAGGLGVIMLSLLALAGWLGGAPTSLILLSLVLATAAAGFLLWNMRFPFRKKAAAFMGDAGSMMLGFAIAWMAIAMATHPETSIYPVTFAWVLLIPCMDTLAVSMRRISLGRSPMAADRAHLHHIFQRCHFSVTATVATIHFLTLATGLIGIFAWWVGLPQWLLFILATMAIAGYTLLLMSAHRLIRWRTRRLRYSTPTLKRLDG